jgi:hypothetical protein
MQMPPEPADVPSELGNQRLPVVGEQPKLAVGAV